MIRVQHQDFDAAAELEAMVAGAGDIGAVVSFLGVVRGGGGEGGGTGPLSAMTLEHYPGMTERELERIEAEARRRWPLQDCLVIHRHGRLEPGARIVLVITASAHRQAAFEACEFLVDWLKTKAPFWKRESTASGESWVEARESDDEAAARWAKG
jgi:molybdopterin synthase catalytic subunit